MVSSFYINKVIFILLVFINNNFIRDKMMEATKVKIFKDPVHGYINVHTCYVKNIIDSEYFQRLRNIEQTGMRVLYPTAKHDRFSHSLGVFHLGRKAVEALQKDSSYAIFNANNYKRYKVLFLVACLLHDIGHTPFSHSLEEQILTNSIIKEHVKGQRFSSDKERTISELLISLINEKEAAYCERNKIEHEPIEEIKAAPHEQLGSYLIFKEFEEKIKLIEESAEIWTDEDVFNDDLCFIVRMIMGIKYKEWTPERQARNCIIELLNGDNFDVDKLDYIVRDTQMSGINNVSVDVERLLASLCVVVKTKHLKKVNLSKTDIKNLTIADISNGDSKNVFKIEGEFKGIIKIHEKAKVEIGAGSKIEFFRGVDHEQAKIAYKSGDHAVFLSATKLKQDDEWVNEDDKTGFGKVKELIGKPNKSTFSAYFEKATLCTDLKIEAKSAIEIYVFGICNLTITGEFESVGSLKLFSLKKLDGDISQVEILGDTFKEHFTYHKKPSDVGYYTYSLGFKKQAINVIANVLEARNYLYLWVYAHHKVIYYANFLIPVITKEIAEYCGKDENDFPSWKLDFNNLDKLDDYYIWTAIKYIRNQNDKFKLTKKYADLIDQLFSRAYNKSLYKSLAEFELVFDSFTTGQKENALKKLQSQTDTSKPFLGTTKPKKIEAGYLKTDSVKAINECIKERITEEDVPVAQDINLTEVIYVVTEFKQKKLDPNKVYLDMGDEILPISQIPLLFENHIDNKSEKDRYFYVYYKDDNEANTSSNRTHLIKEAIKNWLLNKE